MRYMASVAPLLRCNAGVKMMLPTSMTRWRGSIRRYDAWPNRNAGWHCPQWQKRACRSSRHFGRRRRQNRHGRRTGPRSCTATGLPFPARGWPGRGPRHEPPGQKAKRDHSPGKHRGLRTERRRRVDRNANLTHAPILARAHTSKVTISLARVVPGPGLYREVLLLRG